MWRGDPHFGLPGYMRGETQKEKGESPHPAWEPPRTNWWRLLNSTQLSFAVAASGALPSRWAGVLTLRWPSFSGGFTMFHIFQAASLWSPVQLVGPRAPRNGGIHWVVSCPRRVGCDASMRWGPGPPFTGGCPAVRRGSFSAASGDVGWALWVVGLWLNFSLSNGR